MIIDIHCHTSDHPMKNLHVTSASIAALEQAAATFGIDRIFLLATYFPLKGTGVYNLDMLERVGDRRLFGVFGSLDVMNNLESGVRELEFLAEQRRIAGIKLYPGYQGFEPSESRLDPVYDLARRFDLPVMLHGGELHLFSAKLNNGLPQSVIDGFQEMAHPRYIDQPAARYPEVRFLVSHLANPYFEELRDVMRRRSNVFTDISGQFRSGWEEDTDAYRSIVVREIRRFLEEIPGGSERVLFGTDFPIQGCADTFDLVERLHLGSMERENILAGNALSVLGSNNKGVTP